MQLQIDSVELGRDIGFAISVMKMFCSDTGVTPQMVDEAINRLENLPLVTEVKP